MQKVELITRIDDAKKYYAREHTNPTNRKKIKCRTQQNCLSFQQQLIILHYLKHFKFQ